MPLMVAMYKLLRLRYISASSLLALTNGLDGSLCRAVGGWKLIHLQYTQIVLLESLTTDLKACCTERALSDLYGAKLHNEH